MQRIRFVPLILLVTGLLLGTGIGLIVFQKIIDRDTRYATISSLVRVVFQGATPIVKYSGTILRHDEAQKTLVLNVPSSFSIDSSNTVPVMVPYTSDTKWMSIEYAFRNGVMEKRHWSDQEPRQLPRDALVSIVQYYDGTEWQTVAIAYLRKTNL